MEDFERAADILVQMDATGTPFAAAAKRLSYVTLQGIAYNESVPAVAMPSIPDPTTPIPRLDGARARGNFALETSPPQPGDDTIAQQGAAFASSRARGAAACSVGAAVAARIPTRKTSWPARARRPLQPPRLDATEDSALRSSVSPPGKRGGRAGCKASQRGRACPPHKSPR
jgi:hypothetical protein